MEFITIYSYLLMFFIIGFTNAQTTVDWTIGKDYSSYSTQSVKPGGTIVFNYDKTRHNVEVVSKSEYENCDSKNVLARFDDGKTSIILKQGPMYFICGIPGHCKAGMKLQVNVGDSSGNSSTPATPTTPKTPSTSSPATPSAPPPKGNSGVAVLSSRWMLGVSLVLGTLFAVVS